MKRILQHVAFWLGVVLLVVAIFFGSIGMLLHEWGDDES